jgi:hypothetical protein
MQYEISYVVRLLKKYALTLLTHSKAVKRVR